MRTHAAMRDVPLRHRGAFNALLTFIRAFAGHPSMLRTAWYSFFKTDLPERATLLDTPQVFTPGTAARGRTPDRPQ